ncbi:uncharacterized protein LOC129940789 [Eupeodes corollae]|uniref:uncharacterized protein LOC129940789 n=1 Tax=Eupeodes corollae TaxID=290404 RepID=UPI0024903F51|nr:uncharacterized protein LOC129940789 [Eupeodes corollae]
MEPGNLDPIDKTFSYVFRYLTFFGLFTYNYNLNQRKLIHRPLAVVYCAFIDFFLLATSNFYLNYFPFASYHEIYTKHDLALFWRSDLLLVNFACLVISRVKSWTMRSNIKEIFDELNKIRLIDLADLARSNFEVRNELKKIIFLKLMCSITIVSISCSSTMYQSIGGSAVDYFWEVVFVINMILLNAVENEINFGMLYGVYLFKLLNFHLQSMVEEIKVSLENVNMSAVNEETNFLCGEFLKIARTHTKVFKLIVELKNCFQMSIMFILLGIIASQFYFAFLIVVLLSGTFADVSFFATCAFLSLVTAFLNLWLLTHICGDIIDSCNEPAHILGLLPSHVLLNDRLEKTIQSVTLMAKQEQMNLSIYGFFNLEWATAFIATSTALDYLIIVVQFDYYNFK